MFYFGEELQAVNGTDELVFRAEIDTDVENKCMDTKGEGEWDELGDWD